MSRAKRILNEMGDEHLFQDPLFEGTRMVWAYIKMDGSTPDREQVQGLVAHLGLDPEAVSEDYGEDSCFELPLPAEMVNGMEPLTIPVGPVTWTVEILGVTG